MDMAGMNLWRWYTQNRTKLQILVIFILFYRTYKSAWKSISEIVVDEEEKCPNIDYQVFENKGRWKGMTESKRLFSAAQTSLPKMNASVVTSPSLGVQASHGRGDIYQARIERVRELCASYVHENFWKNHVPRGKVWSYGGTGATSGIHYCIMPKVGCTFWKRIFRFLSGNFPKNRSANVTRPSDIDRNFVHYGKLENINVTTIADQLSMQLFSGTNMFLFVRDPYSRLWSAYIDKFLLPDFWRSTAIDAMKKIRPAATQAEIMCPKNITFPEFLTYVIKIRDSPNEHWVPAHHACSPCHVQYDVIGKQETFVQDSKFILNRYGLSNLIEEEVLDSRVNKETSMLIDYNFALENAIVKGCFQKLEVATRLWQAFQYNGYVDEYTSFPVRSMNMTAFNSNPKLEFSKILKGVIQDQQSRGVELKWQKRAMMAEAYRKVPDITKQMLKDMYRYDFELFEYESEPKDLFS